MNIVQSIILGIVQGLTEFLPVSSSAHLEVIPWLLKWKYFGKEFDVALHIGTFLGILFYYRKEVVDILGSFFQSFRDMKRINTDPKMRLPWLIIVSSLPAIVAALTLKDAIEEISDPSKTSVAILLTAICLIVFGIVLEIAEKTGTKQKDMEAITFKDAVITGLFQALALIPGVSRSGITMTSGLFLGQKRDSAANYSFLISLPVIGGAALYEGVKFFRDAGFQSQWVLFLVGIIASAVSGYLVINFLLSYLKKGSFTVFVVYRIILGLALIFSYFFMLPG
ncbi:MAG: undecaprenyl-diphosphatase UppP [Vulcanimicrobiota bacterium]